MTSPTDRLGTKFPPITEPVYDDDGRRIHRFRQSSLKDLDLCFERARRNMSGLFPSGTTDAAALGTAVHLGIELCLEALIEDGEPLSLGNTQDAAQQEFSDLMVSEGFRWVDTPEPQCRFYIGRILALWWNQVLPTLKPARTELNFGPLILHEDNERVIEITGTIDYFDKVLGLVDWKTSGRKYEKWQYERWDLQSSVYTWAARQLGYCADQGEGEPFTFFVFIKKNEPEVQQLTVYRHQGDWNWLKERCIDAARLVEAELPSWPKNDNHALCSEKWCPVWSSCKGAHYSSWPKPSRPVSSAPAHRDHGSNPEIGADREVTK